MRRTEQPAMFSMQPPNELTISPMLAFGASDVVPLIRFEDMSAIQVIVVACAFVSAPARIERLTASLR